MRSQDSLENTVMLRKLEGSRERGRLNMRCMDSENEAKGVSLQDLSRAVEDRTLTDS